MKDERDRLDELFEELENVRVGRRVRRRATAVAASVAIVGGVIAILTLQPTPAHSPSGPTLVIEVPEAPVEPAPVASTPSYAWLERVSTETSELAHVETSTPPSRCEIVRTSSVLASVTIVDDRALAESLPDASPGTGVARVNGRVILTGALAHRDEASPATEPAPQIGL